MCQVWCPAPLLQMVDRSRPPSTPLPSTSSLLTLSPPPSPNPSLPSSPIFPLTSHLCQVHCTLVPVADGRRVQAAINTPTRHALPPDLLPLPLYPLCPPSPCPRTCARSGAPSSLLQMADRSRPPLRRMASSPLSRTTVNCQESFTRRQWHNQHGGSAL